MLSKRKGWQKRLTESVKNLKRLRFQTGCLSLFLAAELNMLKASLFGSSVKPQRDNTGDWNPETSRCFCFSFSPSQRMSEVGMQSQQKSNRLLVRLAFFPPSQQHLCLTCYRLCAFFCVDWGLFLVVNKGVHLISTGEAKVPTAQHFFVSGTNWLAGMWGRGWLAVIGIKSLWRKPIRGLEWMRDRQ